jgi:hypothetical protein
MPGGLDPVEVGRELHKHSHDRDGEEDGEPAAGEPVGKRVAEDRHGRWLQLCEALLLAHARYALVSVGTGLLVAAIVLIVLQPGLPHCAGATIHQAGEVAVGSGFVADDADVGRAA